MSNFIFCNKMFLITRDMGSFGNVLLNRFLQTDFGEIRTFSRNAKKRDDMCHKFHVQMPDVADKINFFIGNVNNQACVCNAMHGVDYSRGRTLALQREGFLHCREWSRSELERKIGTVEIMKFRVCGDKIEVGRMLLSYTLKIINLLQTENFVTVIWAGVSFDPKHSDTFGEKVVK